MPRADIILNQLYQLSVEKKDIASKEAKLKEELQTLYETGEVDKKVINREIGVAATYTSTTTWKHSQSVLDDIKKLKNYDCELGHAVKKETWSWTVRTIQHNKAEKDGE